MTLPFEANALREPLGRLVDRVPGGWEPVVRSWWSDPAGRALVDFVDARVAEGAVVYPADVFRALALTPLERVRVVILGQDPYHGPGQAHGLAFSVPEGARTPPSLRNILAELKRDLGVVRSTNDLSSWARQGVLLLNTSLTVEAGQPASHARRGWEALTQSLLRAVTSRPQPCAYLLWGAHAQQFEPLVLGNASPDALPQVLKANHPSPLSARRPPVPFLGCGHFGAAGRYLESRGEAAVDWSA
jgi:uracil-DNA glycosylase